MRRLLLSTVFVCVGCSVSSEETEGPTPVPTDAVLTPEVTRTAVVGRDESDRDVILRLDPRGAEGLARIERGDGTGRSLDEAPRVELERGHWVTLDPPRQLIADWADTLRAQEDLQTHLKIGRLLLKIQRRLGLPEAESMSLAARSIRDVPNAERFNLVLAARILKEPPLKVPPITGDACDISELLGSSPADGAKRCVPPYSGPATRDFPLKNLCVRDQANRGTCTSFAVAGALEDRLRVTRGTSIDFSEQYLFASYKLWVGQVYGDGSRTAPMLEAIAGGTKPAFEGQWPYNPSLERIDDESTSTYQLSCNGYMGPVCADTSAQVPATCSGASCTYDPMPITGEVVVNDLDYGTLPITWLHPTSLVIARALVRQGIPLVMGTEVTKEFMNAPKGQGSIRDWKQPLRPSLGSHGIEVVDAYDNGSFVVRNSWGCDWGNAGHAEIELTYLLNRARKFIYVDAL